MGGGMGFPLVAWVSGGPGWHHPSLPTPMGLPTWWHGFPFGGLLLVISPKPQRLRLPREIPHKPERTEGSLWPWSWS